MPQQAPEILTLDGGNPQDAQTLPTEPAQQMGSMQRDATRPGSLEQRRTSHDAAAMRQSTVPEPAASRPEVAARPASRGRAPGHAPRRTDSNVGAAQDAQRMRTANADASPPAASGSESEPAPRPASVPSAQPSGRPMTAKKAPPKAPEVDASVLSQRRGRLRPPDMAGTQRKSSLILGVHVYKDSEQDADDDDIDVVHEKFVTTQPSDDAHGTLTRDMFKAKEAAEHSAGAAADGPADQVADHIEGGITLKRTQRRDRPAAQRIDLGQLQSSVESLVQGIAPLAQAMEHLQVCTHIVSSHPLVHHWHEYLDCSFGGSCILL